MSLDETSATPGLSADERTVFDYQYRQVQRSATAAVLLAIFLGGFGAHHFYMGRTGRGVLYLAFCWTLVPTLVALVEALFMPGRVKRHNRSAASAIAAQVRLLGRSALAPAR